MPLMVGENDYLSGAEVGAGIFNNLIKNLTDAYNTSQTANAQLGAEELRQRTEMYKAYGDPNEVSDRANQLRYPYMRFSGGYLDPRTGNYGYGPYPWSSPRNPAEDWSKFAPPGATPTRTLPQAVNTQPTGTLVTQQQTAPVPTEEMKKLYPSIFK